MKNLTYLFVLLVAMFATSARADKVGSMTTFTAGTPAVADEVNANFNAVATAVDANDGLIVGNTVSITSLSGDVNDNTVGVASNAIYITSLSSGQVATNASGVSANANDITTNGNFINANANDIGNNANDISTNTTAIADLPAVAKAFRVEDGSGVDLGLLLNISYLGQSNAITYISDNGYARSSVSMSTGFDLKPVKLHYVSGSNCLSVPYAMISNNAVVLSVGGQVGSDSLIYANPAAPTILSSMGEIMTNGTCLSANFTGKFRAVIPNDPAVTGIAGLQQILPLTPVLK